MKTKNIIIFIVMMVFLIVAYKFYIAGENKADIQANAEQEDHIKIGRMALVLAHSPSIVMEKNGILEKNNIKDYEFKFFTKGDQATLALGANEIDAAFLGAVIPAITNGLDVKIVALNSTGGAQLVCMTPGIKSLADLKGKKVGTLGATASPTTILTMALNDAGISSDDVKYVHLDRTAVVLALTAKKSIDCAALIYPQSSEAIKNGAYIALDEKQIYNNGNYPLTFLAVKNGYAKNNRKMVEKLVSTLIDTQNFINENNQEALKLIGEYFEENNINQSIDDLDFGMKTNIFSPYISKTVMEKMIKAMKDGGVIENDIKFEDLVDCSFGLCAD